MLFSLNVYKFFHVSKTFEMEKKRFENKIRKLRHCLHFTKSKTFSFCSFQSLAKIKNFRNKKIYKINKRGVFIRVGCLISSKKINQGGDVYLEPKSTISHICWAIKIPWGAAINLMTLIRLKTWSNHYYTNEEFVKRIKNLLN